MNELNNFVEKTQTTDNLFHFINLFKFSFDSYKYKNRHDRQTL